MNAYNKNQFDLQQEIRCSIEVYGWHVIKIASDELGPSYGYSIGLFENFNHPEVIIIGPEPYVVHYLINQIGEAVMKGMSFQPEYAYPTFIEGANLRFASVDKKFYNYYVDHANHYYGDKVFPLLQCLYPDPHGFYPDQAEWPVALRAIQPFLGSRNMSASGIGNMYPKPGVDLPIVTFTT